MQGGVDPDSEELLRRWRESERRSRERRASAASRPKRPAAKRRPRGGAVLWAAAGALAVLLAAMALAPAEVSDDRGVPSGAPAQVGGPAASAPAKRRARERARPQPTVVALRRAWRYARSRGGEVSFAVVDTQGRLRGRRARRRYVSASVVKAMLLAAEVRRLERQGQALDPATDGLLEAMITRSDNDAADSIYARVGDAGLNEVARAARARRFTVAGYWANAQITAADMARFFVRVPRLVAGPHRGRALALLRGIVDYQRWGVPRAAGRSWAVLFKGGWRATGRGELVHQAALLRSGRRKLAIAVLTDAQPSRPYAIHTLRGVADRLLASVPGTRAARTARARRRAPAGRGRLG
ncbi:MAG TPA: serine hydrolase [Thermoleophilaceae bacterium]|nr:serine hydrolase [Thermoleophilaceae bacterium]